MSRRLVLLMLSVVPGACGESQLGAPQPDAHLPDAGAPLPVDAGAPGFLQRLDWRNGGGQPLATTEVSVPGGELFALGDDGFVVRDACDAAAGCAYTWRDDRGSERLRRERLLATTLTSVSSDGRRALLMAVDEVGPCDRGSDRFTVERGRVQLVDLATGAADLDLPMRTNTWTVPAFSPDGRWFFAAPNGDGKCLADRLAYRSVAAPFAEAPGLAGSELGLMPDAHRWFVLAGLALGVVDPDVAGSFRALGDESYPWLSAGGWLHLFAGIHQLAHEMISLAPDGQVRRAPIEKDEDWFANQAFGRWVRVCGFPQAEGYRQCRILDAMGERSPVDVRVTFAPDHRDDGVLLGGAFVFVGPVAGGARAVQRLDLTTGELTTLHEGDGELRPLGDGAAALLLQAGDAWLIEVGREELVASDVRYVITAPRFVFFQDYRVRQQEVALLAVSADLVDLTLLALDVRTHRLARLSDRAYLTPQLGGVPDCGQPGPTRHAGGPLDGLVQDASQLFFVETPAAGDPTLWVLPIDLSAPPRRLATLADPAACHPPLTSPSGRRVGFLEDDVDVEGARLTVAGP